ncbi:plasmid pRiA4b ORF-3 family protein [Thiococcus pfennigii]|uniref:plasmid pRiA4b ORF-3 family protein n=1 Tax=Thiococcus pfennigii TaxID=1057 RepID=UPI001903F7B5|nr:plasmid pRiA4b ORF-3 family protein [Thiococcus pfennigii]MBK1699505.1 hypothetical protein [Thiococcus pfennigii]
MADKRITAYQLKISLVGAKPPIWRRLLIAGSTPLPLVHEAIQVAMGWTNSHLHQFVADGIFYGMADDGLDFGETLDESRYKLSQLLKQEQDSLIYEYDFGDDWRHKVTLEKISLVGADTRLPLCLGGKRACPPEDVGGIWGYRDFLDAIADPKHPEHEGYLEWVGGAFDPGAFDIDEVNALLPEHHR